MPFINVKTSKELSSEKIETVKTELGKAISLIPGKSEAWLMVNIEDKCNIYFKGTDNNDTAYVEVNLFGDASKDNCEKLTIKICNILDSIAEIPSDRIYVKYEFCDMWGYNNFMF